MLESKYIGDVSKELMERGKQSGDSTSLKFNTYYRKVKRLSEAYAKVTKSRNSDFSNSFLNKEFNLPCLSQLPEPTQTEKKTSSTTTRPSCIFICY
jgi:hypothetical protein